MPTRKTILDLNKHVNYIFVKMEKVCTYIYDIVCFLKVWSANVKGKQLKQKQSQVLWTFDYIAIEQC